MPWKVEKSSSCPASKPWAVVKKADGKVEGCHASKAKANKQLAALYALETNKENSMPVEEQTEHQAPPRDDLFRMLPGAAELQRADSSGTKMPTLVGDLAVFNRWTEVDSFFEGNFLERLVPGAFDDTLRDDIASMRVLYNHGFDSSVGQKPLGPIEHLKADGQVVHYEVPLLDTQYCRELAPGLEAGLYGSSFRFQIIAEEFNEEPGISKDNPKGLPERSITKVRMKEFGPVTFPQYKETKAGLRSITDQMRSLARGDSLDDDDRTAADRGGDQERNTKVTVNVTAPADAEALEAVAAAATAGLDPGDVAAEVVARDEADAAAAATTPDEPVAAVAPPPVDRPIESAVQSRSSTSSTSTQERTVSDQTAAPEMAYDDRLQRIDDIRARMTEIDLQYEGRSLPEDVQTEWDGLRQELPMHERVVSSIARRRQQLTEVRGSDLNREDEQRDRVNVASASSQTARADVWDMSLFRSMSDEQRHREYGDRVKRVIEGAFFPHPDADQARCKEHMSRLLARFSADDEQDEYGDASKLEKYARRILSTGSPAYIRTFQRGLKGQPLSQENYRALSLTGSAGGFAVPFTLDPTIIPTSNSTVNPWRALARVESIVTDDWKGVTSAGVTATRANEAAESSDNAPTLAQPTVSTERVHVFIPFSFEVGQDWGSLQAEMAGLIQDAKDDEEAASFTTGNGTPPNPQGVITGATTTVAFAGTAAFAIADLYTTEAALGPRFRPRAQWVGSRFTLGKARQFDTAGGSGVWLQQGLSAGLNNEVPRSGNVGAQLIGYPVNEASAMAGALTTGSKILILGDFRYFIIVDRIGLNLDLIPHLFGASQRPTGQRGLYAFWRNSCKVLDVNAFRVGVTS